MATTRWWEADHNTDAAYDPRREEHDLVRSVFEHLPGDGWLRAPCPRCEESSGKRDKKASLNYNTATGGYVCYKCQISGQLPEHMQNQRLIIAGEPAPNMVEQAHGYLPVFEEPGASSVLCEPARTYIASRGLDFKACQEARVGTALWGKLARRIIIPILQFNTPSSEWLGWVARDFSGTSDRVYLYPKGMRRGEILYNSQALYDKTDRPLFVVEGTIDALALWPDAVAVLGKPTNKQTRLLVQSRRPIAVALDGDAYHDGWALAMQLRALGKSAGCVKLPAGKDPDEVERSWLEEEAVKCLT